ncbi:hypothetical protein ACWEVD_21165 [Nocardia thailandica]|uniref:Uridine kinase n=1 Tax=Nocardia thailandica TaxID=257275 RepID=A0ABW6PPL6_9NOCA|nr:hypothetical protein [Nocardia thailandica]
MPRFAPITPAAFAALVADRLAALPGRRVLAVDGADAAEPLAAAARIVEAVRERGRSAETVALHDFVRPASLRMEFGHTDEWSYRRAWFDYAAVRREILVPLRERGTWLPALWDEAADRSARAAVRAAPADLVLVLAGPMLLGRDLPFDLTVELAVSEAALRRRTPAAEAWTLPALAAHRAEHPQEPTWSLRWDHPDRPALRT